MLLLSDTGLILDLAYLDLLPVALPLIAGDRKNIRIGAEVSFFLAGRAQAEHPRTVVQRAIEFCKGLKPPEKTDLGEIDQLAGAKLDYGERVLIASTKPYKDFRFGCGDKNALRELQQRADLQIFRDRLAGKCICLEQAIKMSLPHRSFKKMAKEAAEGCKCDRFNASLRNAFGHGNGTIDEAGCLTWLDSYVDELRAQTGTLLVV